MSIPRLLKPAPANPHGGDFTVGDMAPRSGSGSGYGQVVNGAKFWHRVQLKKLAEKRLAVLDHIETRLRDERFIAGYRPAEIAGLVERIAEARAIYRQMLAGTD
jgi:hypothetical protein